jgi:TorA maturation chaperone TorD
MGVETDAILAARRSAWYWFLAELFLTCPDNEFVARCRRDIGFDANRDGGEDPADPAAVDVSALSAALPDNDDPAGMTDLAVEYTRLFGAIRSGYGPPPPYESVHRKAAEPTDLVVAVNRSYDEAGLAPIDHAVPSDHLGVELKFVALLCHAEMEAWQQGHAERARRAAGRQREFLDRHLLRWAPDYLELVQAEAKHSFYRCLAVQARKMMAEDDVAIEGRHAS